MRTRRGTRPSSGRRRGSGARTDGGGGRDGRCVGGPGGAGLRLGSRDPQASEATLTALETAAAREGRAADFLTLRRMRRAAGLKPGRRWEPEMALVLDFEDSKATYGSILNAMLKAMEELRDDESRELEQLLKQVERTFRDGPLRPCGSSHL